MKGRLHAFTGTQTLTAKMRMLPGFQYDSDNGL
jgi:hypothetical protein